MLKSSVGIAGRTASRAAAPTRVRVMITMDAEVLAVFKRMAAAASISVGRCIGDWCGDTVDGAAFVASKVIEAKQTPKLVMQEMHAGMKAVEDELFKGSGGMHRVMAKGATGSSVAAGVARGRAAKRPPVL